MLAHETFPYTEDEHEVYFVDVYDHASRVVDALDAIRDNLSGLLDLQTAQRANRMNEVMKTLTIISTIFLPLSFIVGMYGMNFKYIPELNWRFGYLYCWVLLILVTALFVTYFKRKGWW
jgi:magnesium transporter